MRKTLFFLFSLSVLSVVVYGLTSEVQFYSPAFSQEAFIPNDYAYYYKNLSPPLRWHIPKNLVQKIKSFAIICDDPDAPMGTWVHWVIFNIPASYRGLPAGIPKKVFLKDSGIVQGINDFKKVGYDGPAPPPPRPHRYFFKLYGLKEKIYPPKGKLLTKEELLNLMRGKILFEKEFFSYYATKK